MAKYTGKGGKFYVGTAPPTPVYTEVAQVSSIGSVAITADEVEVTTLDNTSGFREYLQTFKDAGELPLTLVWDPALPTHGPAGSGLWALMVSGAVLPMRIEFPILPTAYVADFNGFVKSFPTPALTPDDALTADVSIRVSGTITLQVKPALDELSAEEAMQAAQEYRAKNGGSVAPLTPEQQAQAIGEWRRRQEAR